MFSGKSKRLFSTLQRHIISQKRCLLVRYQNDIREHTTHDGVSHTVDCPSIACSRSDLSKVIDIMDDYDVIGIDEAQFYDDIKKVCLTLKDSGKTVLLAGLISTFEFKLFPSMIFLIPHLDKIKMMASVCIRCGEDAIYSVRRVESELLELIGGRESYEPLCRLCYLE